MIKTYVERSGERFALYQGIGQLYGGWLMETGGNAVTLEELESCGADDMICDVNALIATPGIWEMCDERDYEYVADWLAAWGIEE